MVQVTYPAVSISIRTPDDIDSALSMAADAVGRGARLVEWRLDGLAEVSGSTDSAVDLVARSPAPSIATCRGRAEGGEYDGDDPTRESLYKRLVLADKPPRYIDIDLAYWKRSETLRTTITAALAQGADDLHTSLMLSTHDFDRRPGDLLQRVEAMSNEPACSVIKIAWHARSLRDNLEALDLVAERSKPTVVLCMGEFGLASRVLAAKSGALLTYASVGVGAETAPGQPTIDDLLGRYRFEKIGPATAVYGVIGWPVAHSLGPVIHNAGFGKIGYDGVYLPMPIPPEYEHFKATVGSLVDHGTLRFRGASVTTPHKENLVRFVRERGGHISETAERLGAANTLVVGNAGSVECTNTDAPVILASLCGAMGLDPEQLHDVPIAVLGAGGVARAVVGAVADAGARVVIFNRTRRRAELLADRLGDGHDLAGRPLRVSVGDLDSIADETFRVFVNCTSVGMAGGPAPDASPLPESVSLDESVIVFDTVYAPPRTALLRKAEAAGAQTIGGLDMFLRQAALQFLVWTECEAPIDAFRESLTGRIDAGPDPT
jgi:3-dehydroquinate dehydratase/shikimate dehydrogenase